MSPVYEVSAKTVFASMTVEAENEDAAIRDVIQSIAEDFRDTDNYEAVRVEDADPR